MGVHIEHVQREYSEGELLEFGKEQARAISEIARLEDEKKQAAEHFKSVITQHENEVAELSKRINLGYEIVPTPCDVVLHNPTRGLKSFVCQKTLRIVRTVPMTDEDKQLGLYGTDK